MALSRAAEGPASARRSSLFLEATVADRGVGIPADKHHLLLLPFSQARVRPRHLTAAAAALRRMEGWPCAAAPGQPMMMLISR